MNALAAFELTDAERAAFAALRARLRRAAASALYSLAVASLIAGPFFTLALLEIIAHDL